MQACTLQPVGTLSSMSSLLLPGSSKVRRTCSALDAVFSSVMKAPSGLESVAMPNLRRAPAALYGPEGLLISGGSMMLSCGCGCGSAGLAVLLPAGVGVEGAPKLKPPETTAAVGAVQA